MDKVFINHGAILEFTYRNVECKTQVLEIFFGTNDYIIEPQWILRGWDVEEDRFFEYAMYGMTNIRRV